VVTVFESEPDKCLKAIQKLAQINVLTTDYIVKYAVKRISETNDKNSLAHNLIREALQRESLNKWQTVTRFFQKPPVNTTAPSDDLMGENELYDKMPEESHTMAMTYAEYEYEFNSRLANEIQTFK